MRRIFGRAIFLIIVLALLMVAAGANTAIVKASSPVITISPTSEIPGNWVTVTGLRFSPGEKGITITFDGVPITFSSPANSDGWWTASFRVPALASGSHNIKAYGANTPADSVPAAIFILLNPSLAVSTTSGSPGSSITVDGSGFASDETGIAITFDSKTVTIGISADSKGNWNGSAKIPPLTSGSHKVSAFGPITQARFAPGITFVVNPAISLNPPSGPPSSTITVTGAGFNAGEKGIAITFDGNSFTLGISADSQGSWSGTFVVPAQSSGSHKVSAYGAVTQAGSFPAITFVVKSAFGVSPNSGSPGNSITVTGSGFNAGETGITITFDNNPVTTGISADSQGNWSGTFNVPALASGSHKVSAYGSITPAGSFTPVTFNARSAFTVSPASGSPGSSITVTGSGFNAEETGITITFDGNPVTSGISADSQGNWNGIFKVPALTSGFHKVSAYGSITQAGSIAGTNFGLVPGISINPSSENVGGTVQIKGFGFASNSLLTFTYDDNELLAEGATTDAIGSFTKSFTVPKSKAGAHVFSVVDGQKNSTKAVFNMDSIPPQIVAPSSPGDGAKLGILGGITPTFTWSNVADPSGVTYTLEVDITTDFSKPVLNKTDIQGNRYTLTATEALPRGQYYWRVKAVDGASNESAWSEVRLLQSGMMPLWALMLIILVGVAAIGTGVYFYILRPRMRRQRVTSIPEVTVPQVVTGHWREIEFENTSGGSQLTRKLILPDSMKEAMIESTEDQARLMYITDFAKSLPLVEPSYNVDWLVDLVTTGKSTQSSAPVYEQLLKGEPSVCYEPQWMHHPIYQELITLLDGKSIQKGLNEFIDMVNQCALQATSLLQEIYHDVITKVPPDFMEKGGWTFISAVYSDAVGWSRGKFLCDASERDYIIQQHGNGGGTVYCLGGEKVTPFADLQIRTSDEEDVLRFRSLHLDLRRTYRENREAREIASMVTRLEIQRVWLLSVFSQFDKLNNRLLAIR